jgi:hypothetical protein
MKLNLRIPAVPGPSIPYIFIFLAVIIFFTPLIFTSNNYFIGDIYTQFYPWKFFLQKSIQSGNVPFWNPLVYSGVPFAADVQKGVFYPLSIFFLIFGFSTAFKIYVITHFLIMGFAVYSLLRRYGFSSLPSCAGVMVFLFNTFTLSKINFLSALGSYSLMPLILLCLLNFISKKEISYLILFILSFSLSVLAGHPPTAIYTGLLVFLFWIFETTKNAEKLPPKGALGIIFLFLFSLLLVVLLSMPQTGLFYELLSLSSRGAAFEYNTAAATSMSFKNLWAFIMPAGINGFSTAFLMDWKSYAMGMMNYFSITGVFLVFLSLFYPKTRLYKFCLFMVVFSVIMALGKNTPVHSWFFTFLPFFSLLRHPGFAMTLFVVPCSIIIAFTVENILTLTPAHVPIINRFPYTADFSGKIFRFFAYIIITFTVVLLLLILNHDIVMKNYNLSPRTELNLISGLFIFIFIFSINALLFFFREKNKISPNFYFFTLLFMLFFELSYFISGVNPMVSDIIYGNTSLKFDTTSLIKASNYKFLHTDDVSSRTITSAGTLLSAQMDFLSGIPSNTGILYGLSDAGGYNPVEPKLYTSYLKSVIKDGVILDYDKLSLLNVKYLITLAEISSPNFEKIYDGNVKVFKNLRALPVFFTSSSKDSLDLIVGQYSWSRRNEYDYSSCKVDVSIGKPGYFIFSNNFYPGWTAYVDNQAAVIEKCFGIYMGIKVSEGSHEIILAYTPTNLKLYFILHFIIMLSFILFGITWLFTTAPAANRLKQNI